MNKIKIEVNQVVYHSFRQEFGICIDNTSDTEMSVLFESGELTVSKDCVIAVDQVAVLKTIRLMLECKNNGTLPLNFGE